jgi:hypothetical protein
MALQPSSFNRSILLVLGRDGTERPWRWNPEPVYGNGPMNPPTAAGVKQTPSGVFVQIPEAWIEKLREGLSSTQLQELSDWVYRVSNENPLPANHVDAATWHIPIPAGETRAVFFRVPAAVWNDPTTTPPAKVRNYFRDLYREATT